MAASRRSAAALLGAVQGLSAYRALGKRLPGQLEVAAASPAELEQIKRRLGMEPILTGDPNVADFVARRDGKLIGCATYVYRSPDWSPREGHWLTSVDVLRPYRGLGVGEALTQRVISEARARGATQVLLEVFNDNVPAGSLYRKLGFQLLVVPGLSLLSRRRRGSSDGGVS